MLKSFVILLSILCSGNFAITAYCSDQPSSENSTNSNNGYLDVINKLANEDRENLKQLNHQTQEQALSKKNELREERANGYYQKGLDLTEQGKFDEARIYFEKAIKITERDEMALNIKKGEERLRIQEAALSKAKRELDFDKRERLKIIEQNKLLEQQRQRTLERQRKQEDEAKKKQEEKESFEKQKQQLQEALKEKQRKQEEQRKEKEDQLAKAKQEEAKRKEDLRKERETKDQLVKQTQSDYSAAQDLYRDKMYAEAKDKFQIVNKEFPNFKATDSYLKKIDSLITDQQKRQEQDKQNSLELQRKEEYLKKKQEELSLQEQNNKKALEQQRQEIEQEKKKLETQKVEEQQKQKIEDIKHQEEEVKKRQEEQAIQEQNNKRVLEQQRQEIEQEKKKLEEQKVQEQEKQKILEQQRQEVEVAKKKLEEQRNQENEKQKTLEQQRNDEKIRQEEQKQAQAAKAKEDEAKRQEFLKKDKETKEKLKKQADADYRTALDFYREKKFVEAKSKFEAVIQGVPGYGSANSYLRKIDNLVSAQQKREELEKQRITDQKNKQEHEEKRIQEAHQKWVETHKVKEVNKPESQVVLQAPKQVVENTHVNTLPTPSSLSIQEQQSREARLLGDLAEKSSRLYRQISDLADDKNTLVAKKKLAKVDEVLNNLKEQKERNLIKMRENEERKRQQELKSKEQFRLQEASKAYEEALSLIRSKNFQEAKKKFLEVENIQPNFKATQDYLSHIDADQRKVQEDALAEKNNEEQKRLQEEKAQKAALEESKRKERMALEEVQRKEKIRHLQDSLVVIAQKAASINDQILSLTEAKDYQGAKLKFNELEQTMFDLKKVKDAIALENENGDLAKAQAKDKENSTKETQRVLQEKRLENIQNKNELNLKERQRQDVQELNVYKNREEIRQRNIIFRQGVEFYKSRKYTEAKIIFGELASKGDDRAKDYLNKIDQIMEKNIVKAKNDVEHERSDYLKERVHQERIKDLLDVKDQARQRKLSQELEKQKQALEEENQIERRRIESLKLEEKQRQKIEDKKAKLEAQNKKENQQYHFRKVEKSSIIPAKPKEDSKITFSNASKTKTEEKKQKETTGLQEKQNKQKELADLQEKERIEKQNKQKELADLREKERIEKQKKMDIENTVKEKQNKLDTERRDIRRQLETGVDAMYVEALKFYKSGNYQAAASRFSDIQDLIPGYKESVKYLKKTESRISKSSLSKLPSPPQTVVDNTTVSSHSQKSPAREDQIAKTLDLFDSNPK